MSIHSFAAAFWDHPVTREALRYAVSIISVCLAGVVRLALNPLLGDRHVYTLFFAALAFTAWFSGYGPSLLAVVIAYLIADWLFVTPRFEFDFHHYSLPDFVGMGGFVCSGLAIALTTKALQRAKLRAEARQLELAEEITRRERIQAQLEAAKAELQEQAATLEKRVAERTASLVDTIHSLEGVCYHLAHDLRAPLRAMEGYNQILLERPSNLTDEGQRCVRQVCAAAARMDYLIFCLQDYGRLGHQKLSIRSLDLEAELRVALASLASAIQDAGAKVEIVRPLPRVEGDAAVLQQILKHLLTNAFKFVAPGVVPSVRIRAEPAAESVKLWIEDNGIGISPEYHQKIFQIFERLHQDEARLGSGIGLAIVAKAVCRLRGRVGLESEPGKGSRFWVELPSTSGVPCETWALSE